MPAVLQQLAADAAAMLDRLASERDVDPDRVGFFGPSQAGWIIPWRQDSPVGLERRSLSFSGRAGFDPLLVLSASRIPTLSLHGGRDASVLTFASIRVLDAIRTAGNDSHTVVVYPTADHGLREVDTGRPAPIWNDVMRWLKERRGVAVR